MAKVYGTTTQLSAAQVRFLDSWAKTHDKKTAMFSAGWSASSAPQMARRTLEHPRAQEYLERLQLQSRAIVGYTVATAMEEAAQSMIYAKEKGNAMAYVKAVELRCKLSGLLIDRIQVEKVDLTAALEAAQARVIEVSVETPSLPLPDSQPVDSNSPNIMENGAMPHE